MWFVNGRASKVFVFEAKFIFAAERIGLCRSAT
jgi:hypothetical protein